ncbi:MAG: hypothetical protein IPL61_30630 [Myxococcales bacterium]|nr:hypothetical protein [Myxococcales bacterium]
MRIALTSLLVIHGLIHLLGFVKAFGLATVPQLRGATIVTLGPAWQRPIGALWLAAAVLVVVAAVAMVLGVGGWWRLGLVGLVLSQALVIYAWPDAKVGTLPNVVLALAVLLGWADARFERATDATVRQLYIEPARSPGPPVTAGDVATLPPPVARWLTRAGVVGRPRAHAVRLRQLGGLRTAPGATLMPATAEQYVDLDRPGFVWSVDVMMKRVIPVRGRDTYLDGRGHMLITVGGLVPFVDSAGPTIDQGALVRFLGELVWSPSAALAPYLTWQGVDAHAAVATMTWGGVTASGTFSFDDDGRVTGFAARRYLGGGPDARLEDWRAECSAWAQLDGVEVPVRGRVIWALAAGDFEYYQWEVAALEHDRPTRFAR